MAVVNNGMVQSRIEQLIGFPLDVIGRVINACELAR
jgi:hypothetical protein